MGVAWIAEHRYINKLDDLKKKNMHKSVGMCDFTCHESTTALFPLPTYMLFYFYFRLKG